jgi:aspartate 1-decarboxylase
MHSALRREALHLRVSFSAGAWRGARLAPPAGVCFNPLTPRGWDSTRTGRAGTRMGALMRRTMLGGKIHRATVTEADVDYEGSVTIDADLLDAADILEYQAVWIWDADNAARLQTYALAGPRGSGIVCVNGAAAHLVDVGDSVIIASFVDVSDSACRTWAPNVVFVDAENRIRECRAERVGQTPADVFG